MGIVWVQILVVIYKEETGDKNGTV